MCLLGFHLNTLYLSSCLFLLIFPHASDQVYQLLVEFKMSAKSAAKLKAGDRGTEQGLNQNMRPSVSSKD